MPVATAAADRPSQPALSIRLVAHPAVVVNYNMESKIIIFSTSPLHQAPLQLAAHALQPYALKQGGACGVFPQEFEFNVQNLKPDWRLWWPNILAGWRGQVRVEAARDLPRFKTFSNNLQHQDCKCFEKVKVILCTLATAWFKYSVLDKASMAKDLERYMF